MKTIGIIAEYNPFHNGHLYHLKTARDVAGADNVVVVMSGNFVQRGEPAALDKFTRTKMCLLSGVDLVLELPVFFSTASAEFFAAAAVKILDRSGIVDSLCFGSESGNLTELQKYAELVSEKSPDFISELKNGLRRGESYPRAQGLAVKRLTGSHTSFLSNPNNILGVEYLKALKKINSAIKPFTVKRKDAEYHSNELTGEISSASAIRKALAKGRLDDLRSVMPEYCFEILKDRQNTGDIYTDFNVLSHIFQYALKRLDADGLRGFSDVSEGLENRILKCAGDNFHLTDILSDLKTKRYTLSRLRRILLHIILDIKSADYDLKSDPCYIRVLGFRKDKNYLVSQLIKKSTLPVVTNLKNADRVLNEGGMMALQKELRSTDIYYLSRENYSSAGFQPYIEYKIPMVMV